MDSGGPDIAASAAVIVKLKIPVKEEKNETYQHKTITNNTSLMASQASNILSAFLILVSHHF